MRKLVFTVAALAACAPAGACAIVVPVAAVGVGMATVQDRTPGQIMDDASDYTDVKARLLAADAQGFAQTHVQVYGDNLLLTGTVPDEAHRQTAEMIARNIHSLHNVYDEIFIGQHMSFARGLHDGWIETDVRAFNINIEVFHANVYLLGTARSQDEIRRAAEVASHVTGVHRVISFMEVVERERPNAYTDGAPTPQYPRQSGANGGAQVASAEGAPISQRGPSY